MGIDYTAFLKARVQADPNEAKKPDQQEDDIFGLNNEEIKELDKWIRKNTIEKFGPVRSVKPEMVFEISFENIQVSNRHKAGISVRFPRISKWRKDKSIKDAGRNRKIKLIAIIAIAEISGSLYFKIFALTAQKNAANIVNDTYNKLSPDIKNSLLTKIIIPKNPIKTPANCFLKKFSLKKRILIIRVNKGVSETITPATALEISVSAKANKQFGKKVPINAENATHLILFLGI